MYIENIFNQYSIFFFFFIFNFLSKINVFISNMHTYNKYCQFLRAQKACFKLMNGAYFFQTISILMSETNNNRLNFKHNKDTFLTEWQFSYFKENWNLILYKVLITVIFLFRHKLKYPIGHSRQNNFCVPTYSVIILFTNKHNTPYNIH